MRKIVVSALLACCVPALACPDDPAWKSDALARLEALRSAGGSCPARDRFQPAPRPLRWSLALEALAVDQSTWMAELGRLVHLGRSGESLGERARQTAYVYQRIGENVATGFNGLDEVIEAWLASERHCRLLLDPAYTELGLACVRAPAGSWWALTMGQPRQAMGPLAKARLGPGQPVEPTDR